ncbi:MAG: IS481 family transposase [Spirochaetales bacterium]|uniref:IS481 family transposase n=1 Tax=Candidatus Thalassospirochaeta sargassi TaxID=3119039 RepID=A0AAJ1IAZ8_9SPIO|nr:IS481 family transposase [Spirochaetales bacterium]
MNKQMKARLQWVEYYLQVNDAGLTCRRYGISRPTLRKWVARYKENGVTGLESNSRRPKNSPNQKLTEKTIEIISSMRKKSNLGNRRIQSELKRRHNISLSRATIHKVLSQLDVKPLRRPKREKKYKRYEKAIPGERVQMDVCKIKNGCYQYTAIDDCSRYRVLRVYSRRTAKNTLDFIDCVIEEMPFPIQRFQTDRGKEFFAFKVQERLQEYCIKFRPIKPASPHLNGKVERSQQTDLQEFYPTIDFENKSLEEIDQLLSEWQHYYNWNRPHGSLNGLSPIDRVGDRSKKTPYWDEIEFNYLKSTERIQEQNYYLDLQLRKHTKS